VTDVALDLMRRERLDAIVFAGTDLSALFDRTEPSFPTIDCARIHVAAITDRMLRSRCFSETGLARV